jgi:serine carboxypeptidase 1
MIAGGQSNDVFQSLSTDFMRDVIDGVDRLLARNFSVTVYSGQVDLICAVMGTQAWLRKLKWSDLPSWQLANMNPIYTDDSQSTKGSVTD